MKWQWGSRLEMGHSSFLLLSQRVEFSSEWVLALHAAVRKIRMRFELRAFDGLRLNLEDYNLDDHTLYLKITLLWHSAH